MGIYYISRMLVRVFLFLFCRFRVNGRDNLPAVGPVVVVSNHVSMWDPVLIACAFERRVRFMAKEDLFHVPLLGWFLRAIGCFPVRRGQGDRAAIKAALELLQDNEVLGLFPEGTRSKTGELQKPHGGAAMLALKSGACILPVACQGTRPWISRRGIGPFRGVVGEPLTFPEWRGQRLTTDRIETVSKEFMEIIAGLAQGSSKSLS
jgi:1-acyl-sn-glycerol-3-phosphate acyltransferase